MTEGPGRVSFIFVTGLSGAGRTEAGKALEDLGYFVIDNLPPALIEKMAELIAVPGTKVRQVALVIDVRSGEFFPEFQKALSQLKDGGAGYRILFLEAADRTLVRRFDHERRVHPLAGEERVVEGINKEREIMRPFREQADVVIDTTDLNVHELRDKINALFGEAAPRSGIAVNVMSFGYKHGTPLDADMVFDSRFLPNPHWVDELRPFDGNDERVRNYVMESDRAMEFLSKIKDLVGFLLPGFVEEGKHYLTIAVGCTGGRHRSVVVANELANFLRDQGFPATIVHRDLKRD